MREEPFCIHQETFRGLKDISTLDLSTPSFNPGVDLFNYVVFGDGDDFCEAFAEAQVHISHITSGKPMSDMTYVSRLMKYSK